MGLAYAKAVVLRDGAVIGRAMGRSGGVRRSENAARIWAEALKDAGVDAGEVARVFATGKGRYDVPFRDDQYTEPVCAAKAAAAFCPGASMVIDAGADEILAVTLEAGGRIREVTYNQKCSAGCGLMLESIADRLEYSLEELGQVDLDVDSPAVVSDGCMPFAELDALGLLNRGVSREAVAAAVLRSAAVRASVVLQDVTRPDTSCVAIMGGLTQNAAFLQALEAQTGLEFQIAADAVYLMAAGAALMAAGEGAESREPQ